MKNKIILGSVMGIAAIAVAIDHTKHKVPEPQQTEQNILIVEDDEETPCGLDGTPCGLDDEETPCGINDETPCGM
jgi:hypothetical protein